jgi:cell division transport system permease protein
MASKINLMLYRTENAHFLTLITGLMGFIVSLILVGFLLSQKVLRRWDIDLSTNITVQVMPEFKNTKDADKNLSYRVQRAQKILEEKEYLRDVKALQDEEQKEMLEPWLGKKWDIGDVPMPILIAARVVDAQAFSIKTLTEELEAKVGNVVVEDHYNRLSSVRTMANALSASLWGMIFLIGLGVCLTVIYSTKSNLDINRNILEILSNIGASENYIAKLFAKKILVSSLLGGILGACLAVPGLMLLDVVLLPILGYDLVGLGEFIYLLIVPFSFALLALLTAEIVVYRRLDKLY